MSDINQPQTKNREVRLHYRDVSALINLIEQDYQLDDLSSEEKHAFFRLKELKAALESYTAFQNRMALKDDKSK